MKETEETTMNTSETTTEIQNNKPEAPAISRLVFPHGVANLTIRVDASMAAIYRGEFYGPKPRVTEADGVISIDYPRFNPLIWGRTAADLAVSPSTAWFVDIRGGVSRWDADLRNASVTAIDVHGGLNQVDLQLPAPSGTVKFRVTGGASHLRLRRPDKVPARLHIGGGASKLALDDQSFGSVGGPVRLESPGYSAAANRYEIEIGGGASQITVTRD
jgi:hypothetical protein